MQTERREILSAEGGRAEIFSYDFTDDTARIIEIEDCGPITEAARVMADRRPGADFRHVAYIPGHVLNRAFREGWFHDRAAWKRWANDPDNADFRTWKGRL